MPIEVIVYLCGIVVVWIGSVIYTAYYDLIGRRENFEEISEITTITLAISVFWPVLLFLISILGGAYIFCIPIVFVYKNAVKFTRKIMDMFVKKMWRNE